MTGPMINKKMMHAYANSEREARVESEDPHALVGVLFDELVRAMHLFLKHIAKESCDADARSNSLSRALTIIYSLQSSLNFDQGGEVAENLFRLYEYARQQLLNSSKTDDPAGVELAVSSLEEIRDAWQQMGKARAPGTGR